MFEIYCGDVVDLLSLANASDKQSNGSNRPNGPSNGGPIPSHADGLASKLKIVLAEHSPTGLVHVEGARECTAHSLSELIVLLDSGLKHRATSSTKMNAESSRSHLLMSLVVTTTNRRTGLETKGKLTLVDLAGSERVGKSEATGQQLKEAQSINKSLRYQRWYIYSYVIFT